MIRVAVGADAAVERTGLAGIIERGAGLALAGSGTVAELPDLIADAQPEVLLVELSGPAALGPLLEAIGARTALVVLTDGFDGPRLLAALRTGLAALLPRSAGADEIRAAVAAAASGLVTLPRGALDGVGPPHATSASQPRLTARETEVLNQLAGGFSNKEIARTLGISEHTVKAHVAALYEKLGVVNRTEAVMLAARLGLLML